MSVAQVRETLAGRYELGEVLGRGGMGVVYRAQDRVLARVVAIKLLLEERADDPTFVARFEREARAAAALSHPNIVSVFDTGTDDGTRYIVMECVRGWSLGRLLHERGALPPRQAAEIGAQIANALSAAHQVGIVHRDVKPANVMVDETGTVKVLDFGIARAIADSSLTRPAAVLGSAPYMAPEIARGERADQRSDIYSLGCVLYELLTGRPPFTAEHAAAVLHQHNQMRPRPLRQLNPDVPPRLEQLVLRMLRKRPGDRPQTADEVARALESSARGPAVFRGRFRQRERIAFAVAGIAVALVVALLLTSGGSSGHRRASSGRTGARSTRSATRSKASTHGTSTRRPSTTTPTHQTSPPIPSVADAAGALTRLATQDSQSGTIDQHASQQIIGGLTAVLNAYDGGQTSNAAQQLQNLPKQILQLSQHGDIQQGALPAIDAAIASLGTALAHAPPVATTNPAGPAPPGQGDHGPGPPGQQKKQSKH